MQSSRPPSPHPRTKIHSKFQIAKPPPKSSQRLRLSPKLLLQVQQLPSNHRPVPVLEIWQPPLRKSKLTKAFPTRPKLGTRDIYATLNEPYITSSSLAQEDLQSPNTQPNNESNAQERDIVAAMCKPSSPDNPTSAIHFRYAQCTWQGSVGVAGHQNPCYRFVIRNKEHTAGSEHCRMIMQWEKRAAKENDMASSEQFVLVAIDRKERRKSRIATMTREGFEIAVRKSSVLDHLRTCMALTEPVSATGGSVDSAGLEAWLYTLVLTLGVSVASREGWLF